MVTGMPWPREEDHEIHYKQVVPSTSMLVPERVLNGANAQDTTHDTPRATVYELFVLAVARFASKKGL